MSIYITYGIILVILLALELAYFKIADKCNIIDKPNERSSHSTIVLRGGGIIFLLGAWVWSAFFGFQYPWFILGLTLIAGVSFIDDIRSLPDSVRLVAQFAAAALAFYQLGMLNAAWFSQYGILMGGLFIMLALVVYVGATNVINFMDGINGITGGYSLVVLGGLAYINASIVPFVEPVFIYTVLCGVLVFCFFNFRKKAKCFAGDVGSVSIAFILLFLIGKLIIQTGDFSWIILLSVYGVDSVLTIIHRLMLHENIGLPHRKHMYQLMANELKMPHVVVSGIYMAVQVIVIMGYMYFLNHGYIYLSCTILLLSIIYIVFMKKFFCLHISNSRSEK